VKDENGDLFADSHNILNTWKVYFSQLLYIHRVSGCETWSLTLREEHRLRVCENRVLRRIFGPKRVEVTEEVGEKCIMRSFITCIFLQV
jgi:hypothetical protein